MKHIILFFVLSMMVNSAHAQTYQFNSANARLTSVSQENITRQERNNLICMALVVYHEARGTTQANQTGVAYVTLNRALVNQVSVCQVVYERRFQKSSQTWISQFSWSHSAAIQKYLEIDAWNQSQKIAWTVMFDPDQRDITHGAMYFHEVHIHPQWSKNAINRMVIGKHVFFDLQQKEIEQVAQAR